MSQLENGMKINQSTDSRHNTKLLAQQATENVECDVSFLKRDIAFIPVSSCEIKLNYMNSK